MWVHRAFYDSLRFVLPFANAKHQCARRKDFPGRRDYFNARPEAAASRGFYPIPRSFRGLTSRKALKNARSAGCVPQNPRVDHAVSKRIRQRIGKHRRKPVECGSRTVEERKLTSAQREFERRYLYAGTQKRSVVFKTIVCSRLWHDCAYTTSPYRNLNCFYMRVHQRASFLAALARNLGLFPRFT